MWRILFFRRMISKTIKNMQNSEFDENNIFLIAKKNFVLFKFAR